ncbi:hypothetical protein DPX16_14850 [Anabarilius grahami]|uniref:Transposase Tc1-like domain-containing protein n=1 Tax=Anabarilius grahami TaxID=495550 RepID=A0A3N0YVG8_ANAGA|nr:hypothetical protein DPX16_14850 [Anabarilius grahami]
MSSEANSTCRIGRKKADEDQLQPTVRNTLRKLSQPTNKNCPTADQQKLPNGRPSAWCVPAFKDQRKTSRELNNKINTTKTNGATVSSRTVRRKLGEVGLVGRIAAWKPLLKEKK